jgi:hypothetical protein
MAAAEQETMSDVRSNLLDMAEMHVLVIAAAVAASFVYISTIAPLTGQLSSFRAALTASPAPQPRVQSGR